MHESSTCNIRQNVRGAHMVRAYIACIDINAQIGELQTRPRQAHDHL
jgi:hypothetical protein